MYVPTRGQDDDAEELPTFCCEDGNGKDVAANIKMMMMTRLHQYRGRGGGEVVGVTSILGRQAFLRGNVEEYHDVGHNCAGL